MELHKSVQVKDTDNGSRGFVSLEDINLKSHKNNLFIEAITGKRIILGIQVPEEHLEVISGEIDKSGEMYPVEDGAFFYDMGQKTYDWLKS